MKDDEVRLVSLNENTDTLRYIAKMEYQGDIKFKPTMNYLTISFDDIDNQYKRYTLRMNKTTAIQFLRDMYEELEDDIIEQDKKKTE